MGKIISPQNFISAAGRLYEYGQNRRYQVKHNTLRTDDEIGKSVLEINNKISHSIGLDIFTDINTEDLNNYLAFLNNLIIEYTGKYISKRDLGAEISTLRETEMVDLKIINERSIYISAPLAPFLPDFRFTQRELLRIAHNPSYLAYIKGYSVDSRETYISTAIRDEKVFLMQLSDEEGKRQKLGITAVFTFKKNSIPAIDNPTRLFLSCLDNYGIDIEINGRVKRIFDREVVHLSSPFKDYGQIMKVPLTKGEKTQFQAYIKLSSDRRTVELEFVYGVNWTKYLSTR